MTILGISGSLRAGSYNRALLAAAAAELPAGVEFREWRGLETLPAYDEDCDGLSAGVRRRTSAGARRSRRGADRDAGVQPLDSGRAQERARLGLASLSRQPSPRQAGRGHRREHRALRGSLGAGRAAEGAEGDRRRRPRAGLPVPSAGTAFTPEGGFATRSSRATSRSIVHELARRAARRAAA